MNVEIFYQPSNSAAKISLLAGDGCTTESGCMIAMSPNLSVETTTHKRGSGSVLKSIKRLLGGESLFLNHYQARQAGDLWVSSTLSGDLMKYELNNNQLIVQAGSFVAADDDVNLDVGWQGFKTFFSGESLFWLKMTGKGTVLLSSFGCIYEVDVNGDYTVDTGHIVAFEETLSFSISKAGSSWIDSFLGGEGLVCKFSGRGKLYCQSHNPTAFGNSLSPHLRSRKA
jgi:uncharacterized protein (TIGR00266 family)